jgi:hypothetical protein
MKVTDAPSRIVGVQFGSLNIAIIKESNDSTAQADAKFGLITEEGEIQGFLNIYGWQWSEKARKALQEFIDVIEEEALKRVFKVEDGSDGDVPTDKKSKDNNEPAQF